GPTDPTLVVVAVRRPDGTPFSLYANYSLHYVGGTGGGVSADYYGAFAQRMKDLLTDGNSNKSFVGMLSNGTSGNINNVDFFHKRQQKKPFEQINLVAGDVAAEALRVYSSLEFHDWIPLRTEQPQIDLGVRRPDEEDVLQAKKIVMSAKGPTMQTLEEIYARETIFLSDYPERVPLILQAFRIQDLAIAAIPCEVFVEIGLELREKSPFTGTFTVSLANGYNGYLPTPEHHDLGGYETWRARSSYLEREASRKIVEKLVPLIRS